MERVDPAPILATLKDFQRATAEYIFRRMYLDVPPARRFLLADEVGLGKTLVAKGVVAKTIDHLWEGTRRIDVIYICSNHDIARQNINRLNVTGEKDAALPTRITYLPIAVRDLKRRRLNFITFTPGTSFDLRSRLGTAGERALLYWMLKEAWDLRAAGCKNLLQGHAGKESFRARLKDFERERIDRDLLASFVTATQRHIDLKRTEGKPDLRARFDELCERFGWARKHIPKEDRRLQTALVGELRGLLAASCLEALEPDLVIMDEFQRFKYLLEEDGDNTANQLARNLFEYPDVRILLLSATPYKMYTIADEIAGEDHYEDFLRTLRFLEADPRRTQEFEDLLSEYRREVLRIAEGDGARLRELKAKIEGRLRSVMVRTERLSVTADRSGMLVQVPAPHATLEPQDLEAYLGLGRICRTFEHAEPIEYWKSCPYPLSFMEDYKLKTDLLRCGEDPARLGEARQAITDAPSLLLTADEISRYAEIDPCNARLRSLAADTLEQEAWRLLWMPPSLPYHLPGGPYASPAAAGLTKRLVFSSWHMVPKAISCLLSYEAERRMMSLATRDLDYSPEGRKKHVPLLRFNRSEGRLTGMPVLGMLYPSFALAELGDPLVFAATEGAGGPRPVGDLLRWVEERIRRRLDALPPVSDESGPDDATWYWVAPILLDQGMNRSGTREWFGQRNLAELWSGQSGRSAADADEGAREAAQADAEEADTRWADHAARAQEALGGVLSLGPRPADLVSILALMAVGGPGAIALRALNRAEGDASGLRSPTTRNAAARVAWGFLSLFNLPESMALIRHTYAGEAEDAYWKALLRYCVDGGLQSVLDEYAHVLRDALGLFGRSCEDAAPDIADEMLRALGLRTSRVNVDVRDTASRRVPPPFEKQPMRARFAVRFGQEEKEGGGEATHADQIRAAFNSPFWPFVLATTSVGQEGLDFHLFCHAVVHWNLPANPVDLEQREGRVHRYKGHAIRKNLALKYGIPAESADGSDPWGRLFARAQRERAADESDIVPYWVYCVDGGARIERHVPLLPLSADAERLTALRRSLAAYRMVFGQARQDELVEYLTRRLDEGEIERVVRELAIDLAPPGDQHRGEHPLELGFDNRGLGSNNLG